MDPTTPLRGSVLIIDDSPAQLAAMRERLVRAGYAPVSGASDWAEGRRVLAEFSPAVIILDVQLPGMVSGDVMATQLRRHPSCRGSKILFHSGVSRRDLAAITARVGADGFIEKGRDLEALVVAVTQLAPPAATVRSATARRA